MKYYLKTTNTFEGIDIEIYLDVISSNVVIGRSFFSDFEASLYRSRRGGFSNSYQNKLNIISNEAVSALKRH